MTSIRRAMRGVRQALGESGESQRSVRTVRGFGYQFRLPVQVAPASAATSQPTTPARTWEAELTALRSADTLPLFGGAAKRLRDEAWTGWID